MDICRICRHPYFICDCPPFEVEDDEAEQLREEDRQARAEFAEERSEP